MSRFAQTQMPHEYEVVNDFGPSAIPLTLSIQQNINASIDLVKQNRLDIIRLDNEVKSSKIDNSKRFVDDSKLQQEISLLMSQNQSEKSQITREITQLKVTLEAKEDFVRKSETVTKELISKNKELARTLSRKQEELDSLNQEIAVLNEKLEGNKKTLEIQTIKSEKTATLEAKAKTAENAYNLEVQRTKKLRLEIQNLQASIQAKSDENERAKQQLRKLDETITSSMRSEKLVMQMDSAKSQLNDELHVDLKLMISLKDDLEGLVKDIMAATE